MKKELEALRGWPWKDNTPYKDGIARRLRMKKKKKAGKKATKWQSIWEEERHLEDRIEKRSMEGSSLKLDVIQKVPGLVAYKRMSQGDKVKNTKKTRKCQNGPLKK